VLGGLRNVLNSDRDMAKSNWHFVKIDEIKSNDQSSIAIGPFGSRMTADLYRPSGVPVIRGTNISSAKSFEGDFVYISEETANDLKSCLVYPDDLVFPHRGAIGLVGIVPRDGYCKYILSSSLMKLSCNKKIADPYFLFYFFRSPIGKYELLKNSSTVGTPGIATPLTSLKNIELHIPPLPTQKAIAHILGTLDDKIELNRRMNETLESIARAIFKSWFIDFDPVRTKAETRQPEGIDAATAALFPSDFETVEGQEIPKGWKISTLGEHIESVKGLSYKGDGLCSNGIPLHNLNSVLEGGGYKYYGIKYYSGEYKERHILKNGDIIVANTEQGFEYLLIGYPAIIPNSYDKINLFSHHLFRVRPFVSSPCKTYFIYHLLMSPAVREQIIGCTNGTTVNMLKIDGLIIPKFVLPSTQLIDKFDDIVSLLYNKIEDNVINSRNLEALRDTLLPKLLSGELPIENPEQFTGVS
jgi:type I restriction enzyme S subunit